jgi:hypothetical protein
MLTRLRSSLAAMLAAALLAIPAYGQDLAAPAPAAAPANLAFVAGVVDVVQDGLTERADLPVMLVEGDIVRTRQGRAEIVFGDGSLLHLAEETEIELLGDERLRLRSGRVMLRMSHAAVRPYVIDTPAAPVRLDAEGEYGVSASATGRLEVTVARGAATVDDAPQWSIRGGQMITRLGPSARPLIASYNSAAWDAFGAWSYERATGFGRSASAARLPYELRPYAPALDAYGRWDYVAPHGYVWFPSVHAGWRPYHDGSWAFTRYGWTWHGRDRWAWPTHHYGRWGFTGAFWYWIPATVWAPAWVTWSVGAGYVSWAPYGWHRPYDAWDRRDHPAYRPNYDPWRGWTVLPRQHFGPRRNVRSFAIDGHRLDDFARREVLSRAVPAREVENVAVPRGSTDAPGARGNVRRPPPSGAGAAGVTEVPRDSRRVTDPPARSGRVGDHPAYTPPESWSGGARRAPDAGERRGAPENTPRAERPGGEHTRDAEPRTREGRDSRGSEPRGGGAVRAPGATPRDMPSGRQPSTRTPPPRGSSEGATERAVPRGARTRPPGDR